MGNMGGRLGGQGREGRGLNRISIPTQRGRNVGLILAISMSGVVSHRIISDAFNTVSMSEWCRESLLLAASGRRVIYVMDNARFHHAPVVSQILTSDCSRVLFLPPYSPQPNPIEQVFGWLKSRFRSHTPRPSTTQELFSAVENSIAELSEVPMVVYYENMRGWLIIATQRQPFI